MYAIIPAIEGVPQVGKKRLHEAISISDTQAVTYYEGELEDGWTELTEEEYTSYWAIPEG